MVIIRHDATNTVYVTFFTHEALEHVRRKHGLALSPSYPMLDESKAITHWEADASAIEFLGEAAPDSMWVANPYSTLNYAECKE